MAGGKYNDLRKLSHDIERKRKELEESGKQAELAQRENLSKQMRHDMKRRQENVKKIAEKSHFARNIIFICVTGCALIAVVILFKTVLSHTGTLQMPRFILEESQALGSDDEDYLRVNSFVQKLLATCKMQDTGKIIWTPALLNSEKEQYSEKLNDLTEGFWQVSQIKYNEKLNFFSVVMKKQDSDQIINLRLSQERDKKLGLSKAF